MLLCKIYAQGGSLREQRHRLDRPSAASRPFRVASCEDVVNMASGKDAKYAKFELRTQQYRWEPPRPGVTGTQ